MRAKGNGDDRDNSWNEEDDKNVPVSSDDGGKDPSKSDPDTPGWDAPEDNKN